MKKKWFIIVLMCVASCFISCEQEHSGIVTFYGTVSKENYDHSVEPLSGAIIYISGSDTPGGSAVTGSNGYYELPVFVSFKTYTYIDFLAVSHSGSYTLDESYEVEMYIKPEHIGAKIPQSFSLVTR